MQPDGITFIKRNLDRGNLECEMKVATAFMKVRLMIG